MAIEQEHICPIDTRVEFKTLTGLAQEGKCDPALPKAKLRNLYTPCSLARLTFVLRCLDDCQP